MFKNFDPMPVTPSDPTWYLPLGPAGLISVALCSAALCLLISAIAGN